MFILDRPTSRSSRSLAVMTGFAQCAAARGHGDPLAGPQAPCIARYVPRKFLPAVPLPRQVKE
jgi:hypothetical protein